MAFLSQPLRSLFSSLDLPQLHRLFSSLYKPSCPNPRAFAPPLLSAWDLTPQPPDVCMACFFVPKGSVQARGVGMG